MARRRDPDRRRGRGRGRPDVRGRRRGGGDHVARTATGSPASATPRRCRRPSASAWPRSSGGGPSRSASGAASVAEIDRLNIYHATHLAMRRAIARLGGHDHVLVDGTADRGLRGARRAVHGDRRRGRRVYSIACASVVAKVVRDRMMTQPRRALPAVRLGSQRRLRDARAPRRDPGPRADAPPPQVVAGAAGADGRGPAGAVRRRRRRSWTSSAARTLAAGAFEGAGPMVAVPMGDRRGLPTGSSRADKRGTSISRG